MKLINFFPCFNNETNKNNGQPTGYPLFLVEATGLEAIKTTAQTIINKGIAVNCPITVPQIKSSFVKCKNKKFASAISRKANFF